MRTHFRIHGLVAILVAVSMACTGSTVPDGSPLPDDGIDDRLNIRAQCRPRPSKRLGHIQINFERPSIGLHNFPIYRMHGVS